jgi:hypothetical protein
MSKHFVQNKYEPGDIIYAKNNPDQKLVVRRYLDKIYYCKVVTDPDRKDLVFFEREIVEDPALVAKNKKVRENSNMQ